MPVSSVASSSTSANRIDIIQETFRQKVESIIIPNLSKFSPARQVVIMGVGLTTTILAVPCEVGMITNSDLFADIGFISAISAITAGAGVAGISAANLTAQVLKYISNGQELANAAKDLEQRGIKLS